VSRKESEAPEGAVNALLVAFAHGATCKDDQGMLLLHLAFRNGCNEAVVGSFLMAYPQIVDVVQDRKGSEFQFQPSQREAYIRVLKRGPGRDECSQPLEEGLRSDRWDRLG
jgi:hypothetical protein